MAFHFEALVRNSFVQFLLDSWSRKSIPLLGLAATILLFLCSTGLASGDLLSNPDFSDPADPPTHWRAYKATTALDSANFATGPASLRMETSEGGNVGQQVNGLAGKLVRFQGQARSTPGGAVQAFAMVFSPEWEVLEWKMLRVIPPGDKWLVIDSIIQIPEGAGAVSFGISGSNRATGWLDDTSVTEVDFTQALAKPLYPQLDPKLDGADVIQISPITDRILLVQFCEGIIKYAGLGKNPHEESAVHYSLLDLEKAVDTTNYSLSSANDPNFSGDGHSPTAIGRKSKGNDFNDLMAFRGEKQPTHLSRHWIYLQLPESMTSGKTYRLKLNNLASNSDAWEFTFDEHKLRSESIRVNQLGFRPDAPKYAYVSQWLGDFNHGPHQDGGLDLIDYKDQEFHLVRVDNDETVFTGKLGLQKDRTQQDNEAKEFYGPHGNMSRADVYEADFSEFNQPGRYRVVVPRMGCSFPFEIHADVFREAYVTALRGLFFQRAGIDREVREFGGLVYPGGHRTNKMLFNPEGGRNHPAATDFKEGMKTVEGIWGWYHDAGDWDTYVIAHSSVPALLLLAYELSPTKFGDGDVGNRWRHPGTEEWIDEGKNGIPDILDEAGWLIQYMRRARHALKDQGLGTGGVPAYVGDEGTGGAGNASWTDTRNLAIHPEDSDGTAVYAGLAAWYATALRTAGLSDKIVNDWISEAKDAYEWAKGREIDPKQLTISALGLYRATGELRYQEEYLAAHDPTWNYDFWGHVDLYHVAACLYAVLPENHPGLDRERQRQHRELILKSLNHLWLEKGLTRGFRATHLSRAQIQFLGALSTPRTMYMQVAGAFTGESRYDHAAQFAADYTLGGNQMGLVWMSGIGWRYDNATFHPDSRLLLDWDNLAYRTKVLPGYTPYGAFPTFDHFGPDYMHHGSEDWSRSTAHPVIWRKVGPSDNFLGPAWRDGEKIQWWANKDSLGFGPGNASLWPVAETRFPNIYSIPASEFTVHQTQLHNIFTFAGLIEGFKPYTQAPRPEPQLKFNSGSQVKIGDKVRLAVDTSASTVQVDYYYDWHYIGTSTNAKDGFSLDWDTGRFKVEPGERMITARAVAADGLSSMPSRAAESNVVFVPR